MSEIERTFLVDQLPDGRSEATRIQQAYLAIDGQVEVRVRRRDGGAVVTVKAGRGLERTEVETPIGADDADALWDVAGERRIDKRRSTMAIGDLTAEIDEFDGALAGLCLVEVEFDSRDDAARFEPPDWFGTELTDDDRWSNRSLAVHGRPDGENPPESTA